MAKPPATTEQKRSSEEDVFMREVEDAVRQQDLEDFGRKYGKPLGAALLLGLVGFGGYLFWSGQQEEGREAASEEMVKAMDQLEAGNLDTASKAFAPLAAGDAVGQAASARMVQAGIALQQNKPAEAAKLYAAIAADGDVPELYRNLATIREAAITFDDTPPADVVAKLKPLATPGAPWFAAAGELLAAAYLEQGKPDLAGPILAEIAKDEDAPGSVRSRTRQLAGVLGFDAIEDPEELLVAEGATPEGAAAPQ